MSPRGDMSAARAAASAYKQSARPVKIMDDATLASVGRAYAGGASLRDLAKFVNDLGFTGYHGGKFNHITLGMELGKIGVSVRSRAMRPRNTDDEAVIRRMLRAGANQTEIAKLLGVSRQAVSEKIRRMDAEGLL